MMDWRPCREYGRRIGDIQKSFYHCFYANFTLAHETDYNNKNKPLIVAKVEKWAVNQ